MGKHQKRDKIARLISWGHWFTFSNIILCLAIGLLYIETAEPTGSLIGNFYLFLNWVGHFAFLPFVFFIILIFPFCLLVPYSRVLRGLGALIASFGVFILLFDVFFFRQYGFHLNTYSLAQMARDAETLFAGASFVGLLGVMFGFLLILILQVTLANLTWKRLDRIRNNQIGGAIAATLVSCFLISHIIHVWADAALYTPITQQDDLMPLSYPTTAKSLMARHGWITPESYQSQRDRLTGGEQLGLRYPLSSLLCAKETRARATFIVAFDQLSPARQKQLQNSVSNLQPVARQSIGHSDVQSGAFQLVYSLPDLYEQEVQQNGVFPAYQHTMQNFGHDVRFFRTPNWPAAQAPAALQTQLMLWSGQRSANQPLTVIFASSDDFEVMATAIRSAQLNNDRILVTALTASEELTEDQTTQPLLRQAFTIPMWSANMDLPQHEFAQINDIMPTALSGFISCAEDFATFTTGHDLTRESQDYPRVQSIESRIYIFEEQQTTVLDRNGDISVYSHDGELKPGATPPTPVLINSLKELQRFSISNNQVATK